MLVERVFGQPKTRAQRVRSRRRGDKKLLGRAAGDLRKARRRGHRRRGRRAVSPARERVRFAGMRTHPIYRFGTRWISLIALGVSIWTLAQWRVEPQFMIHSISIEGAYYMSPSRVRTIAGIRGKQNFQVDPAAVERSLEAHPEILSSRVALGWPNQLTIEVEERLPVLEWNDAGRSWLISADGVAYLRRHSPPEINRVHSLEKVLDTGEALEAVIDPDVIQTALDLKSAIQVDQDLFYDEDHGLGFQDRYGWMAYFGTDGDIELKLKAYSKIVEILLENRYPASLVSVEEVSAPYYR